MSLPDPLGSRFPLMHRSTVRDYAQQQPQTDISKDLVNGIPFSAMKNRLKPLATPAANRFFWSPFADFSVPLQAHQQNGPMDISAMLDGPGNERDRLSRDGFRMAQLEDPIINSPAYNDLNGQWTQS